MLYHLNDFKILCPTYNSVADGRPCELCSHGAFRHAATRGCYTGPRSSAMVLAAEAYLHKWLRTYERCVDMFLAPSEFVRNKLIASGFPAQRVQVLPHFQALPDDEQLARTKDTCSTSDGSQPRKASMSSYEPWCGYHISL